MNLKLVFRINSIIFLLNGIMGLFFTDMFFEMANFEIINGETTTIGQFMGVTFLFIGILLWKTPDIAGDSLKRFGMVWALGELMWLLIIGYHIFDSAAGGATAYGNAILTAVLALLFFLNSRESK